MNNSAGRVVVVGGGVIGTACAHYLSNSGWQVSVIDRGEFGKACSHANCGFVCPSHVLPLAEPGVVGRTLKAMFQRNSPFYIKPRLDPALWSWLLNFTRRCNHRDMIEAGHACHALLESSLSLYRELMDSEPLQCEWEMRGLLFVYRTAAEMEGYAATDQLLRETFGVAATRYDADEVSRLEPALKSGLAGGWHYEEDAHLRPDRLMLSWRQLLEHRGVTICEQCELQHFVRSDGRATAIATSQGEISADAFVVATGAWTPLLNRQLGCRIPIQPGKGYSITMPRPKRCPTIPLIFPERRVAVTPMQSGYRLGSTMEFAGYDTSIHSRRLALLREAAADFLQEPYCEPVEEQWYGWRPMTYDSKPIIDCSPIMENVWIATGHNMLGLSMATGTGKLIAELVAGQVTHMDVAPFSLHRF